MGDKRFVVCARVYSLYMRVHVRIFTKISPPTIFSASEGTFISQTFLVQLITAKRILEKIFFGRKLKNYVFRVFLIKNLKLKMLILALFAQKLKN